MRAKRIVTMPRRYGGSAKISRPSSASWSFEQGHRMGATHFLMKTLPRVTTEMALHVLAYNLTRVMNIIGVRPLLTAMRA